MPSCCCFFVTLLLYWQAPGPVSPSVQLGWGRARAPDLYLWPFPEVQPHTHESEEFFPGLWGTFLEIKGAVPGLKAL